MNDHSETVIDITVPNPRLGAGGQSAEEWNREGIYDGYWRDRRTAAARDAERADASARATSALALEAAVKAAQSAARRAMWAAFAAALAAAAALVATLIR
jgi:hypothetical protein